MNISTPTSGIFSSGALSSPNTSNLITQPPAALSDGVITPKALKDATRVIYVIVFIVGILGNIMVCYIIAKRYHSGRRRSIHTFTLNLALADLLVLFIYLPSQLHLFETNMLWKLGDVLCRITYLIVPLSIYSSIGTLIAISRDRYIAVLRPMVSLEKRKTKHILIIIWIVSFILTIPLLLVAQIKRGYCTEIWPNPVLYDVYWIFAFCIQFAMPVLFLAIAHILIIVHLRTLKTPSANCSRALARRRQQQRLITMSICLVLVYVICMLPQHVVFFWLIYGDLQSNPYKMYIFQISNLMLILNSALNPIVYGTLNNDIKRGILGLFRLGTRNRKKQDGWRTRTLELQTITSVSASPLLRKSGLTRNGVAESPLLENGKHDRADTPALKRHLAIKRRRGEERAKQLRLYESRNQSNGLVENHEKD